MVTTLKELSPEHTLSTNPASLHKPTFLPSNYCSSNKMYYYGLKLHVPTSFVLLPMPETSWITRADENDLTAAKVVCEGINNCKKYADKIYADRDLSSWMQAIQNSTIPTRVKKHKGKKKSRCCP